MYKFKLFILGKTSNSAKCINNLKDLLEENFKDQYSLEVVDLLENPHLAKVDKIFTTPTLVKSLPIPIKSIIGDLSDKENVLQILIQQLKIKDEK